MLTAFERCENIDGGVQATTGRTRQLFDMTSFG